MTQNGRTAFDLLVEWLASDQPVNHFGRDVVEKNRAYGLSYGDGLRDLVLDVRSNPNGYRNLVKEFSKERVKDYPNGYPAEDGAAKWTMRQMSDWEFGQVDWDEVADTVFPKVDDQDDE